MPNLRDYIQSVLNGDVTVPVAQLVGFRLLSAEGGQAVWELEAGPHHQPGGM